MAQISQQPPSFEYPRKKGVPNLHFVGPLRDSFGEAEFPWETLDDRPFVYASLGSMQGTKLEYFQCFAEACREIGVQLVISHVGKLTEAEVKTLPGETRVFAYVPQYSLISRASATLTHAGMNTVLDSLSHGVPMLAIPITYEQPAIARRIRWKGCGLVVRPSQLSKAVVKESLSKLLGDPQYARAAREIQEDIKNAGGVSRAASLVETAVGLV